MTLDKLNYNHIAESDLNTIDISSPAIYYGYNRHIRKWVASIAQDRTESYSKANLIVWLERKIGMYNNVGKTPTLVKYNPTEH